MMRALLLLALLAGPARADAPAALAAEFSDMARLGLKPARILSQKVGGAVLHAVIFHDGNLDVDKFNVYTERAGKAVMVYTHPSGIEKQELHASVKPEGFPELLEPGAKTLAYYTLVPGLGARTLHVLRYDKPRFRQAGEFPEGRIEDSTGGRVFIARELPLGRFLSTGCENFDTMTKAAYRTDVYVWKNGRFVEVSSSHPKIYQRQIAQTEESLSLLQKEKHPGEYLGLAISLYYDHAALGEREAGWNRLSSALKAPRTMVPGVASCIKTVKDGLRRKLSTPGLKTS